jgi:hypothetical protein
MKRKLLGAMLILGGMLTAAHADTWVMKDTMRPNGHERSKAAKYADSRKCGAPRDGRSFNDSDAPNMQQCMLAHGWVLDHVIPDPVTRHARRSNDDNAPSVDNSSNDDWVRRQQDQDNTQQMLNTQQMINDQQMQNNQQQQQIIDDMNR